jgi:hypothetical protein
MLLADAMLASGQCAPQADRRDARYGSHNRVRGCSGHPSQPAQASTPHRASLMSGPGLPCSLRQISPRPPARVRRCAAGDCHPPAPSRPRVHLHALALHRISFRTPSFCRTHPQVSTSQPDHPTMCLFCRRSSGTPRVCTWWPMRSCRSLSEASAPRPPAPRPSGLLAPSLLWSLALSRPPSSFCSSLARPPGALLFVREKTLRWQPALPARPASPWVGRLTTPRPLFLLARLLVHLRARFCCLARLPPLSPTRSPCPLAVFSLLRARSLSTSWTSTRLERQPFLFQQTLPSTDKATFSTRHCSPPTGPSSPVGQTLELTPRQRVRHSTSALPARPPITNPFPTRSSSQTWSVLWHAKPTPRLAHLGPQPAAPPPTTGRDHR